METVVRGEHSVVTGLKQTHIASVVGPLRSEETNDLLTVCYKLQNKDLMRGYELMLERVQEKRSVFHAGRDLEMRKQWEVARLCYERLFDAREQQKNEELLAAEANLNYYHCLQCSGNWKEVRHLHLQPSASFAQSLQVLNWKIESAWRGGDWTSCQQFVGEVEWLVRNRYEKDAAKKNERWLFGERRASELDFGFEYYLGRLLLAIQQKDEAKVEAVLEETQVVVVKNLAAHAAGSLYANYEQLLALHMLQDVNWEFHSRKNEERNVWGVWGDEG